ncbi:metallophosphoesterase family protein [Rariglobus hedericola]|uniref:Metallophosphoesterase n=1 Tax=Rariglobus hedericola TaxID=2597822 RepID=A0A556QGN9_9BACT|nr:metallophosphoesterase family protein [Rariglobus hedericola]TSJ75805.1 metallophosphoesterase [Rariglobus hedericola]
MKTIAHISDLHFGTERPEIAAALQAELHALAPALVVVSGDLTQRARSGQFIAARDYLATLPGPQLVVPGNHDVPLYDVARRFLAPLARYRHFINDDLNPVYDDGDLFVGGLNTARSLTWKSGRISLDQIENLQARLRSSSARFKVVVTHHPFIPPPSKGSPDARIDLVGRAARALTILDSDKVDLLLAGHLHHSYSGDTRTHYPAAHRAIISAQAGTAISSRVRAGDPNGYNRITLDGDTITIEVRTWRDGAFSPLNCMTYHRHETGWSAAHEARPNPLSCQK